MKKGPDSQVQLLLPCILRARQNTGLSPETEHELIDTLANLLLSACEGLAEKNAQGVNDEPEAE